MSLPFVTLILPVRNESASIEQALSAILAQDYPADRIEILIADGMSTDDTRDKIHSLVVSVHRPSSTVQILANPAKIVSTGLNLALRQAKGEIILRVDGHTVIAPDYVRRCVETLQRSGAENAGGRMNAVGSTPFAKAVALATSTPFGVGGARFHYSDAEEWVDTVYMGAWPRRVFEQIGLFDEELVRDQDDEFNYRLRQQGGRILLSPGIRSEYKVRSTPGALWRQYYQYGYWKVRVLQKHPRQMSLRQFAPPAFVLALFVSALLLLFPIARPLSMLVPLTYLLTNLSASLWTILRAVPAGGLPPALNGSEGSSVLGHPPSVFRLPSSVLGLPSPVLLPFIYTILHLSYGLGFLIGLLKFSNRWGDKHGQTPNLASQDA